MILVFLGPPGSGKGTQAKKLMSEMGLPQLSTGDMLRAAMQTGTDLGKKAKSFIDSGALVPDEVVIGLIESRSSDADCKNGFILDGFPRTLPQADALDEFLKNSSRKISKVVLFEIEDSLLVSRLSGRRTCSKCGTMYHVQSLPPRKEGICDKCGGLVIQRADDQAEVIQKRLSVYWNQTSPLVGYYRAQGKLATLAADQSPSEVTHALKSLLSGVGK